LRNQQFFRNQRIPVKLTRDELLDVLMDELRALTIWRSAKLPKDVELGVGISIDKITAALKQCGRVRSDR